MGVTNFPNGVNVGSEAGGTTSFQIGTSTVYATAAQLNRAQGAAGPMLAGASASQIMVAGTIIVGATGSTAFVPTGLTSCSYIVASPYGALSSTAGTVGGFTAVTCAVTTGTATLRGYDQMGTASSTAGTASYIALGT